MGIKKTILPLVATAILVGAMFFAGCEKENIFNKELHVMKSDELINPRYYELVDEENGIYLDLQDSSYVTMDVHRVDTTGTASVRMVNPGNPSNHSPIYNCKNPGTTCGNAEEIIDGQVYRGRWYKLDNHITYQLEASNN